MQCTVIGQKGLICPMSSLSKGISAGQFGQWTLPKLTPFYLSYINIQIDVCVCSVRFRTLAVRRTFDEKSGAQLR